MRITRRQMFMAVAEAVAKRSTCFRRSVGAIIVKDNNIVSIGYNGAPPGEPHCTGRTCPTDNVCTRATHAECNALERYAGTGLNSPCRMYVTESPCADCARLIVNITWPSIQKVFYLHEYRLREGIDVLLNGGVRVRRMTTSGYTIDVATGELVE